MLDLHFICPQGLNHRRIEETTYESGNWNVIDATADEAVGGRIYLHERQDAPSWHGGTIKSWRATGGERKVFTYVAEGEIRVRCLEGWGQEKAYVRR